MIKIRAAARRLYVCSVVLGLSFGTVRSTATAPPKADTTPQVSEYTSNLADFEASIHVTQSDAKELAKIGSDFSTTYSVHNMTLYYKQPDKIRLEGRSPTRGMALMILNGSNRFVDVPRFKIHLVENLDKYPTRRQSLLELGGVVSTNTLKFMYGTYVRPETVDGHAAEVFDMKYTGAANGQHYRVWLDSVTHTTVKREWYNSDNQLRATFLYDEPKQVMPGEWLPTRVQIKNAEGVLAAVLIMDEIKVNQGLVDDLFAIPS